jgi:nucleotide-binding universal stress UspA family protein
MIELRRILCPIDFSATSRRALDHALALARWYQADVKLIHVYHVVPIAPFAPETTLAAPLAPEYRAQLAGELARFADTEREPSARLEFDVLEGSPAGSILQAALEWPADLLVLGTHGRSGIQRLLLGSVTERVLRQSRCPVLTVPPHAADAVPVPPLFKRILCAVDFSECSRRALAHATALAQEADAHLTIAHVFELEGTLPARWREAVTPLAVQHEIKELEDERRERLARTVPAGLGEFCTVDTVMVGGTPYREIVRLAAERQVELIVIGVHGRSTADLMFFGSTANHVVREALCPVLTVRTA